MMTRTDQEIKLVDIPERYALLKQDRSQIDKNQTDYVTKMIAAFKVILLFLDLASAYGQGSFVIPSSAYCIDTFNAI